MTTPMTTDCTNSTCPNCGAANQCAMAITSADSAAGTAIATTCWCMSVATKLPVPTASSACYCANCLRLITAAESTPDVRTE